MGAWSISFESLVSTEEEVVQLSFLVHDHSHFVPIASPLSSLQASSSSFSFVKEREAKPATQPRRRMHQHQHQQRAFALHCIGCTARNLTLSHDTGYLELEEKATERASGTYSCS